MKKERQEPHTQMIQLGPEARRARRADRSRREIDERFPTDAETPKAGQVENAEQVRSALDAAKAKRDAERAANMPGPKSVDADAPTREIRTRRSEAPTRLDAQFIDKPKKPSKPTFWQNVAALFGRGK